MTPPAQSSPKSQALRKPLGASLLDEGLITQTQLEEALQVQSERGHGSLVGEILIELGMVSEQDVMQHLATGYGIPFARITPRLADPRVIGTLEPAFVEAHNALPLFKVHNTLTVAVSEPANLFIAEEIERLSGCTVQIVAATQTDIRSTLQAFLPTANVFVIDEIYDDVDVKAFDADPDAANFEIADIEAMSGQSPVVKLVNYIIYQAIHDRASDIHIESHDHQCRVRFRVDGRLNTKLVPPHQMHPALVSRVKIMAGMDISERRIPQDGDIHVAVEGRPIDLRVSTMPGKFGEKVVIRVIDTRSATIPLAKMGMSTPMLTRFQTLIAEPNGMILVTGPTGSGKSTTLYSVINEISNEEINVSTVENPVEAQLYGINQFQVNEKAGFNFAGALRALLRQDPDVIMVGEIRDLETATIATQAALTGHLVLSTLHTNDATSAVTRLINMGVEPFLVAAMLRAVLAQRLVRRVCPHCRKPATVTDEVMAQIQAVNPPEINLVAGDGCTRCRGQGFAGRLGIYELLAPSEACLERIASGINLQELQTLVTQEGHLGLLHDGYLKAAAGLTTASEVVRATTS